jgi:hypothetical protein
MDPREQRNDAGNYFSGKLTVFFSEGNRKIKARKESAKTG